MKLGMVIDLRRCLGCMACVVACQIDNKVPLGQRRVRIVTEERAHFPDTVTEVRPVRCNQCDNPPCISVCPTGATHIGNPGKIVVIEKDRCIGCGACVTACPYGARFMNPESGLAEKCDFCSDRLTLNYSPACVEACPGRAIFLGDIDDPKSEVRAAMSNRSFSTEKPQKGSNPRIFYLR